MYLIKGHRNTMEQVKKSVLSLAREERLDVGDPLPKKALLLKIMSASAEQQAAFESALSALVEDGLFEGRGGDIFLTDKGKNLAYPPVL